MSWDTLLGIVAVLVCGVIYLLPSYIAFNRHTENRWLVLVINVLLGGSLVGWLVALYMATRRPTVRSIEST